jgi:RNA polymerase sigma factor (sigma-70 family)
MPAADRAPVWKIRSIERTDPPLVRTYHASGRGEWAVSSDQPTQRVFDQYLVASARVGDRKAFALLVRRWNGKLLAHGWRLLGDHEAARDAVQDGWGEIVRGLPRLVDTAAFPAWAFRIVTRRCGRAIGRARRERRLRDAIEREPQAAPDETSAARLDGERMRRALASLPAEQRAAIALFHLEELSVAEVAVALDVPVGTVKTRLMNGRRKLRAALEGEAGCVISTE